MDTPPPPAADAPAVAWLLAAAEPWVRYNTLRDLAGAPPDDPAVRAAYAALQAHPAVAERLDALDPWPAPRPLGRAYDPKDSLWKLATLADFGLARDDPRIAALAERVFAAQAEDGGFLHGGFDHTHSWDTRPYICIAHVMTGALARFGYGDDPRLARAYAQIAHWQRRDGGWHPNALNLPGGPREGEPSCPFGTGNVLRALAAHPAWRISPAAARATEFLLACWARRADPYRPVGFGIGSTWDKVQYPFVQYGFLKTVDTRAAIPAARADPRYGELVAHLAAKRQADRRFHTRIDIGDIMSASTTVVLAWTSLPRRWRCIAASGVNCAKEKQHGKLRTGL